eukprot:SAG11_NODE_9370_length_918_cov_1.578755_2_plen_97_part_00
MLTVKTKINTELHRFKTDEDNDGWGGSYQDAGDGWGPSGGTAEAPEPQVPRECLILRRARASRKRKAPDRHPLKIKSMWGHATRRTRRPELRERNQ